jgi:kinetochore protein Nuf2
MTTCTGKSDEDFQATEAMKAKANTMEYGDQLHADFTDLKFFLTLQTLMIDCGVPNFSWRDLYNPTHKRLKVQLAAIINFLRFLQERLKLYQELNEPRTELLEAFDEVQVEHDELKAQLEQTELDSKDKLDAMDEVVQECQGLELEIARNNKLQAAAREEAAALKMRANDLKDELATAVWAFQEAEAEEERLRAQVVSSPDRRRAELEHRSALLTKAKDDCNKLENDVQSAKLKTVKVKQASKDLESTLVILDDLREEATKLADLILQKESTLKEMDSFMKKKNDFFEESEEAERYLHRTEERISHQVKAHKMQIAATQESLDLAKSQLLAVEKDRREGMLRVQAGEAEVRELEAAIERERINTEQEIQSLVEDYRKTESLFLDRNNERMGLMTIDGEA